jgi:DNA-binding MarR family transcriptional regulator
VSTGQGEDGADAELAVGTGEVDALMDTAQLMVAISAQSLASVQHEVTLPQLRVLVILASGGPQGLGAVAGTLGVNPSNATRACDRLIEAGLLRRSEDPRDRRHIRVHLTPAGSELVDKVMRHRRRRIAQLLRRLSPAERDALSAALRPLTTATGHDLERDAWQAGWPTRPAAVTS